MASIKTDQTANGLRNNFEASATHLLPYDPVQKKRSDHSGGKRAAADISDMTGEEADVASFGTKKGTGSTGVALRYHKKPDYVKLSKAQRAELKAWRETQTKTNLPPRRQGQVDRTKAIASAVDKKVAEKLKSMEQERASEGATGAYIMSIVEKDDRC
jgi:hypothetical protein